MQRETTGSRGGGTVSGKKFSDAEVEWAARCLGECTHTSCWLLDVARRALEGGYVPPPPPVPIREQVLDTIAGTIPLGAGYRSIPDAWWYRVADALLAAFDVAPKVKP
jgi:hypothetical protein